MKRPKAVGLLSGGLDSIIAIHLILKQGIDVIGLHFLLPFTFPDNKACVTAKEHADKFGFEFRLEHMGPDYLDLIRNPGYGYGSGINPCIDCKIYMLKRAKMIMEEAGASFVFTGEVLGQRPMSQRRDAMHILERDSGLKGSLLRPLSATHFEETIPEKEGLVDRSKFPDITGRGRDMQLKLAQEFGIGNYAPVAGGCLLTDKFFSIKMRDLLSHNENAAWEDIMLLNFGRHFRSGESKIITGRNEKENGNLRKYKRSGDLMFELPDQIPGPTVLLQGEKDDAAVSLSAALTIRYSDLKDSSGTVLYGNDIPEKEMTGDVGILKTADYYNIASGKKE